MTTLPFSIFDALPGRRHAPNSLTSTENLAADARKIICTELGVLASNRAGSRLADRANSLITDLTDPLTPRRVRQSAILSAKALLESRPAQPNRTATTEVKIAGSTLPQIEEILKEEDPNYRHSWDPKNHSAYARAMQTHPIVDYLPILPSCALIPGEDF